MRTRNDILIWPRVIALAAPTRRAVLTAGGAAAIACLASGTRRALSADPAGSIDLLRGTAEAEAQGVKRALKAKESVFIGDLVSTGPDSRLLMSLGERTTLRLGASTRLRIDAYSADAGGAFEVLEGAIEFERKGRKAKEDLTIRSAYGLIAVRGTRFFAGPSNGVWGVLVGVGKVEVTAAGKSVTLTAGQGTDIAKVGDAPTKPATWKQARVLEALKSVK
jgi:ferric-dicitrate binding protein FerR (iron transport regulator)